jgi:hypothetical protein
MNIERCQENDTFERYQIGVAIKDKNEFKIVTPFFVHVPYSECSLIDFKSSMVETRLKLIDYCYFSRLATYTVVDNVELTEKIKQNMLILTDKNYILDEINLKNTYLRTIDDDKIITTQNNIVFKNIMNNNIYPLVWIESKIEILDNSKYDKIISGTPIFNAENTFLGFTYTINNHIINIIPAITINKILTNNVMSNIFFDYHIDDSNKYNDPYACLTVNKIYSTTKNILIGDIIYLIDNKPVLTDELINFKMININIPINTYLWYSVRSEHIFTVIRNMKMVKISLRSEPLLNKITPTMTIETNHIIKDNIIFCELNLLLIEWLIQNGIVLKNITYLRYTENPYFKSKNNCLFVGLINIEDHPKLIKDIFNQYADRIYNVKKYMEIFTVLGMNMENVKINDINKLVICDSSENEILLNWFA